jgi:hypothetical protein
MNVRQTEIHTADTPVPGASVFDIRMAVWYLESCKPQGIDQIPAEVIKAGGRAVRSDIHQIINCVCNKEELPQHWKESIIVPVYVKCDETDCSHYRGMSLVRIICKILSNNFLLSLTP